MHGGSWPPCHPPPAIYGEGFVKPICRFKSMEQKSARLSPSPSASVDLPHLSRRPAGVYAFCRISLEPEAEGDFPTASVGSSWGRRERDTLNHLFGIVRSYEHRQERTSPGKRYTKDATTQSNGDPSMERGLSSLFAGSRVWRRSLRAYPRRRRRRSICTISAVDRLGWTPSTAYL